MCAKYLTSPYLFCPVCGARSRVESILQRSDKLKLPSITPGGVYQFDDHNPIAGTWSQYRAICFVHQGNPSLTDQDFGFPLKFESVETGELYSIYANSTIDLKALSL